MIGVGPDNGEGPEIFSERQQATGVLEEDDRFPRRLAGELPVRGLVERACRDPRPAHRIRRVEHAQLESRQEQALDRRVDLLLGDEAPLHGVDQVRVHAAALEVGAGFHGQGRRLRAGRHDLVAGVDVVDRAAVRHDVALEAPLAAQDVAE